MREESNNCNDGKDDEWNLMVSLSWDAMHCACGIQSNMYTNEIVGFNFNALNTDALLTELNSISDDDSEPMKKRRTCKTNSDFYGHNLVKKYKKD